MHAAGYLAEKQRRIQRNLLLHGNALDVRMLVPMEVNSGLHEYVTLSLVSRSGQVSMMERDHQPSSDSDGESSAIPR
jgi:hypothetical protein